MLEKDLGHRFMLANPFLSSTFAWQLRYKKLHVYQRYQIKLLAKSCKLITSWITRFVLFVKLLKQFYFVQKTPLIYSMNKLS